MEVENTKNNTGVDIQVTYIDPAVQYLSPDINDKHKNTKGIKPNIIKFLK